MKKQLATHAGTCPLCERVCKLPGGMISLHGYDRPGDGAIVGDCLGSGHEPFEVSCEVLKEWIEYVFEPELAEAQADLVALTSGKVQELTRVRQTRDRSTYKLFLEEIERFSPAHPEWPALYARRLATLQNEVTQAERKLHKHRERVRTWVPKALQDLRRDVRKLARIEQTPVDLSWCAYAVPTERYLGRADSIDVIVTGLVAKGFTLDPPYPEPRTLLEFFRDFSERSLSREAAEFPIRLDRDRGQCHSRTAWCLLRALESLDEATRAVLLAPRDAYARLLGVAAKTAEFPRELEVDVLAKFLREEAVKSCVS